VIDKVWATARPEDYETRGLACEALTNFALPVTRLAQSPACYVAFWNLEEPCPKAVGDDIMNQLPGEKMFAPPLCNLHTRPVTYLLSDVHAALDVDPILLNQILATSISVDRGKDLGVVRKLLALGMSTKAINAILQYQPMGACYKGYRPFHGHEIAILEEFLEEIMVERAINDDFPAAFKEGGFWFQLKCIDWWQENRRERGLRIADKKALRKLLAQRDFYLGKGWARKREALGIDLKKARDIGLRVPKGVE